MKNIAENMTVTTLALSVEPHNDIPNTVDEWCDTFNALMNTEKNAAVAILGYSLPAPSYALGCPLGDDEFEKYGALLTCDRNAFEAAEKTGLIAEGIYSIFLDALDNCDSWSYHYENIKYILETDKLRKYVTFYDRYIAERLLTAGDILSDNYDLWGSYVSALMDKLSLRSNRGY